MKVLVVGATGGSGRATVEELLSRGHEVTALSRQAQALRELPGPLSTLDADATRSAEIDRAVRGQDAVVVTFGISENALRAAVESAEYVGRSVALSATLPDPDPASAS